MAINPNYPILSQVTDLGEAPVSINFVYDRNISGFRPQEAHEVFRVSSTKSSIDYTGLSSNVAALNVPANARRIGLTIFHEAPSDANILWGSGVSSVNKNFRLTSGALYEMPLPIYTGSVGIIWYGTTSGQYYIKDFSY